MKTGNYLSACALAVAIGAASLMAMPDPAAAGRNDIDGPKIRAKFEQRSVSANCVGRNSEGDLVEANLTAFQDVNPKTGELFIRNIRINNNNTVKAQALTVSRITGLSGPASNPSPTAATQRTSAISPNKAQQQVKVAKNFGSFRGGDVYAFGWSAVAQRGTAGGCSVIVTLGEPKKELFK